MSATHTDGASDGRKQALNHQIGSADPHALRRFVTALFSKQGVPPESSALVAEALVHADCEGKSSHGVMLVPMYLERLRGGSISATSSATIVNDTGSAVVLDAHNALGQVSAHYAVNLTAKRACVHGLAATAVRNAFHFGAAGYWASLLADQGLIGVAMSNTRPLMPAMGGAQRVVGNNPLAIAMPSATDIPIMVDMALSATAMGKIRLAATAGLDIPAGWATDANGRPTTNPNEAIEGMLLPAAGPKGFGLACMVDLFCGGLSSGAIGSAVQTLYGNPETPYGCAHFFLAIDVSRFLPLNEFAAKASAFADEIRTSKKAASTHRIFSPGEKAWSVVQDHKDSCPIDRNTAEKLLALATGMGLEASGVFTFS